jgi:PPK2 family polyphosphate:nucleotide phosphotransferase
LLAQGVQWLAEYQDKLYAQDTYSVLIVLQAMDAAGKDGTIKHVMSGLNPQGTQVYSFKAPSAEELNQTYLWRNFKALPERGRIGIFNRSYYEEVLVARVHPEIVEHQKLPAELKDKKIWKRRFEEINQFEQYLVANGTIVLKFFLNVSKEEQRRRFLARLDLPEKNWKFSSADLRERGHWDEYQAAYEDMFNHTSTAWAPWYVVPADNKWFTRLAVGAVIYSTLRGLKLAYPTVDADKQQELLQAKAELEADGGPLEPAVDKKKNKKKKKEEQEGE